MNRRMLYQALLGACLAVSVGGLAAQTPATSDDGSTAKAGAQNQEPAKQEQNAQPDQAQTKHAPPHMAKAKSSSHTAKAKSPSHTAKAKSKSPSHMAKAKSPQHTAKAKSPQHMAKARTEESSSPGEQAYRQALRGCATQKDQSQRDSCLDEAIQKFNRNA